MTQDRPINRRLDVPGQSPEEDRLLAMIAALASELAITRERLDSLERLVEGAGVVTRAAIESFAPDADAISERDALRRRLIDKTFRPLRAAAARAATPPEEMLDERPSDAARCHA